jgi:hypothetical protein
MNVEGLGFSICAHQLQTSEWATVLAAACIIIVVIMSRLHGSSLRKYGSLPCLFPHCGAAAADIMALLEVVPP